MGVVDDNGAVGLADVDGDAGVVVDVDAGGGGVVDGVVVVGGGAVADEDHDGGRALRGGWLDGDEGYGRGGCSWSLVLCWSVGG